MRDILSSIPDDATVEDLCWLAWREGTDVESGDMGCFLFGRERQGRYSATKHVPWGEAYPFPEYWGCQRWFNRAIAYSKKRNGIVPAAHQDIG